MRAGWCRRTWEGSSTKNLSEGASLAVQWLRLCAYTAVSAGLVPDQWPKILTCTAWSKRFKTNFFFLRFLSGIFSFSIPWWGPCPSTLVFLPVPRINNMHQGFTERLLTTGWESLTIQWIELAIIGFSLRSFSPHLSILCVCLAPLFPLLKWKSLSPVRLFETPVDCTVHGTLQARILEWVGLSPLQRLFPTQESNRGLPHCRQTLYQLSYEGRAIFFPQYFLHSIPPSQPTSPSHSSFCLGNSSLP